VSVVFAWAMSAASASASTILSINPSITTVNVGDTVTLNIDIENVFDLFSYNFDLAFDPDILSFQSIVEGEFPKSGDPPDDDTFFFTLGEENPGTISFTTNAIIGSVGVTGGGTLAVATFLAIMAGETEITFPDQFPNQLLFSDSSDNPIAVSAISALVQVNAGTSTVPDQTATMILFATALVALAACRSFTLES
jgi:hypothetical protein